MQPPPQLPLRCRGGHNFLRCAGKEDPSTIEVGRPAQRNNSNSGMHREVIIILRTLKCAAGVAVGSHVADAQGPGRRVGCGQARCHASFTHWSSSCRRPIEASLSSRLSQASSRLTQSFEAKLKGFKPHAGPEDLELEARAGTEAIYTRLRSTPSEAQRLRPLQHGQSWANLNAYAGV